MFLNNSSAFETVQGVLDLLMTKIGAKFGKDYALRESEDPIFFPKRGAEILLSGPISWAHTDDWAMAGTGTI